MKRIKLIVTSILIIATCLLCSCAQKEKINVYSAEYDIDVLTADDYDTEWIEAIDSTRYVYFGYEAYVSKIKYWHNGAEERLCIRDEGPDDDKIMMVNSPNGFLIGVNYSEFGAGVMFHPYTKFPSLEPVKLLDNRCLALVSTDDSIYSDTWYAVTSWNCWGGEQVTALYEIGLSDTVDENGYKKYESKKICDVTPYYASAAIKAEQNQKIYVVAGCCLFEVSMAGEVRQITVPEEWKYLIFNGSAVEVNGEIFFGTHAGVVRYNPENDKITWFPLDYAKVLPK